MRAIVFAYSELGVLCLEELVNAGTDVAAVVTHHDAAGENLWFPSVAKKARAHGLNVFETDSVSADIWLPRLAALKADTIFSFMLRCMLPEEILDLAPERAFNLHPSLLPKYRGRAPANWALVNGEKETGLTLHLMVKHADAGDIVAQERVPIGPDDNIADLNRKFAEVAPRLLRGALPAIASGKFTRIPQNPAEVTKFGRRTPADGLFNADCPADKIHNLVRAVAHPFPGAFCQTADGRKLFVWKTVLRNDERVCAPSGVVLGTNPLVLCAGGRTIEFASLHYEGEPEVSGAEFAAAHGLRPGQKLF